MTGSIQVLRTPATGATVRGRDRLVGVDVSNGTRATLWCEGPECNRRGGALGLCPSHYKQKHLGKPLTALRVAPKDLGRPSTCTVPGCGRAHKARGYCQPHAAHMAKYGEVRPIQSRNPDRPCEMDACGGTAVARGLCRAHAHRLYIPLRYGLTLPAYDAMLAAQGGACVICGGVNANGYRLSVDHDHGCCPGNKSCGKCVRSLLCSGCNLAIGHMQDDPERLRAAADYLDRAAS